MEDPGEEAASVLGSAARSIGVLLCGVAFCVIFGFMGSLTAPGVGAVLGGIIGFVVGSLIGFFACGKYKEVVEAADDAVDTQNFIPESMHETVFGHARFTLYVTVHELTNPGHTELFGDPDFFIKVRCGKNPPKTTCVRGDRKWNETFKLVVEPSDSAVAFDVYDQNTLIDTKVGTCAVPIKEVFEQLNQKPKKYKMRSKVKVAGEVLVSFRPGEDISSSHQIPREQCVQDTTIQSRGHYGTFANKQGGRSPYFHTQIMAPPVAAPGASGPPVYMSGGSQSRV
jgi:hypothetical protein